MHIPTLTEIRSRLAAAIDVIQCQIVTGTWYTSKINRQTRCCPLAAIMLHTLRPERTTDWLELHNAAIGEWGADYVAGFTEGFDNGCWINSSADTNSRTRGRHHGAVIRMQHGFQTRPIQ